MTIDIESGFTRKRILLVVLSTPKHQRRTSLNTGLAAGNTRFQYYKKHLLVYLVLNVSYFGMEISPSKY